MERGKGRDVTGSLVERGGTVEEEKRKAEDRNRNRTDTGGKGMTARIFSRYLYRPGLPPIMLVQLVQSWGEQAVGMRNNA